MSLLNQVLQDLEKRNANETTEQTQLNNIKAVTSKDKNINSLVWIVFLFIGVIIVITFSYKHNQTTSAIVDLKPKQTIAKTIITETSNIKSKAAPQLKQSVEKPIVATKTPPSSISNNKTQHFTVKKKTIVKEETKQTYTNNKENQSAAIKPKPQTNKQKAEQYFAMAQHIQNPIEIQRKLQQTLKFNSRHIKARLLLSNNLIRTGLTDKAANLLDQGLSLFPQNLNFINLRSQLFLQQKQAQAAIMTLLKIDSAKNQNITYLALLAAAYQQNHNYLEAEKTYQKLLAINPVKAEYWLGLAISHEQQAHRQKALYAYQQALDKNTLQVEIVNYIYQRISILK